MNGKVGNWPVLYCDRSPVLGRIIFQYDPEAKWHSVCEGHGVHVDGKYMKGHGGFHPYSNTLVHGGGGTGLSHGDIITHDPESCLKGRDRAG